MVQVHKKLVDGIAPPLQRSCRVLAYVRHIEACLMFLLYQHGRCDSEVNGGKDEKDRIDYVVSTHLS
jgi:hypothetical protein